MGLIELVNKSGISMDMIHYYEQLQLIQPAWKNKHRIYSKQDCGNIRFIERMVMIGLSLEDLQVIFEIKRTNRCTTPDMVVQLTEKLNEIQVDLCKDNDRKAQRLEVDGLLEVLKFVKGHSARFATNAKQWL
ncbi:helix-turn-helix domain-containing protein [Virgibacillus siamensis]|uniref:helix-turn-helix domain-containing protein n=1 Tax=Virgibacillus siamensis TaxID=480071 RepID=UPI00158EA4AF|nr:MerR family transcriptional regulator [Virgibacillus siamensis]